MNGTQVFASNSQQFWPDEIADLAIGIGYDNSRGWNGLLDEVRLSNAGRSADWVSTEFNNQSSPSTFYTLTSENAEGVIPASVALYATQNQQFSIVNSCSLALTWSLSSGSGAGSLGTLTRDGLYTAPSSITAQQTVIVTVANQTTGASIGTANVTLLPVSTPLTLAAATKPPYVTGSSQGFVATLNQDGVPQSGVTVNFTVTGTNPSTAVVPVVRTVFVDS